MYDGNAPDAQRLAGPDDHVRTLPFHKRCDKVVIIVEAWWVGWLVSVPATQCDVIDQRVAWRRRTSHGQQVADCTVALKRL